MDPCRCYLMLIRHKISRLGEIKHVLDINQDHKLKTLSIWEKQERIWNGSSNLLEWNLQRIQDHWLQKCNPAGWKRQHKSVTQIKLSLKVYGFIGANSYWLCLFKMKVRVIGNFFVENKTKQLPIKRTRNKFFSSVICHNF